MSASRSTANPLTLDAIDSGVAVVQAKDRPDPQDRLEALEIERFELQNSLARSRIKNVRADRKMRKAYASRILNYLGWYSAVVAVLLLLHGFHLLGFALPDAVLAALVGSTAVAAIGLVGFVARGLFKPPSDTSSPL